jgi:hypothetical protein
MNQFINGDGDGFRITLVGRFGVSLSHTIHSFQILCAISKRDFAVCQDV